MTCDFHQKANDAAEKTINDQLDAWGFPKGSGARQHFFGNAFGTIKNYVAVSESTHDVKDLRRLADNRLPDISAVTPDIVNTLVDMYRKTLIPTTELPEERIISGYLPIIGAEAAFSTLASRVPDKSGAGGKAR